MATHYEYLTVLYAHNRLETNTLGAPSASYQYFIIRPGSSDLEVYEGEEYRGEEAWVDIANQLGKQGWHLSQETIVQTISVRTSQGWENATIPIRVRYTFQRQAEE